MWGNDKPAQKRQGHHGEGWLRSPNGSKVVRIRSSSSSRHAAWCEVSDAPRWTCTAWSDAAKSRTRNEICSHIFCVLDLIY